MCIITLTIMIYSYVCIYYVHITIYVCMYLIIFGFGKGSLVYYSVIQLLQMIYYHVVQCIVCLQFSIVLVVLSAMHHATNCSYYLQLQLIHLLFYATIHVQVKYQLWPQLCGHLSDLLPDVLEAKIKETQQCQHIKCIIDYIAIFYVFCSNVHLNII